MREFIRRKLNEGLIKEKLMLKDYDLNKVNSNLRFNNGVFNKSGHNTIFMDDEAIVDFGVGELGLVKVDGNEYQNSLYLKGGFNASVQRKGYGTIGLRFIFNKLPKIQNVILQCFDTACPFWVKMGGIEIVNKEMPGGHLLRTLLITRDAFDKAQGL